MKVIYVCLHVKTVIWTWDLGRGLDSTTLAVDLEKPVMYIGLTLEIR